MSVLFVTHKYPPQKGGVGVSAQRISQGLAGAFPDLHVLHATRDLAPGLVQSERRPCGTQVFTLGETQRGAESSQLLEATIRALHEVHRYRLVVGFYAVPTGFTAVFTARFLGLPSVLCLRGNDLDRAVYHAGQMEALVWALRQASAVVAVSRELASKASLLAGDRPVTFIPNAVDSRSFAPCPHTPVLPGHLLFTGEMRLKKGSEVLWPALTQLPGDWSLTLAGGFRGEAEAAYWRWVAEHPQAARRVRLLPYQREPEELSRLYSSADLVLNPALWDGMPNSVLEAMACARPVLSTRVGGLTDLLQDGQTGYLLSLSQLGELGSTIARILQDPERHRVGQRAREQVLAQHQPEQEAQAYRELLTGLLASG